MIKGRKSQKISNYFENNIVYHLTFENFKYSRHFSFVEYNDITTKLSRSFDKFIFQT